MQCDRGLRAVHFMAATKRPDSNALEACSLDRSRDRVLLLQGGDSVIVAGAHVNWSVKKTCARLQRPVPIAEMVLVRAGYVNPNYMTTISGKERRDVTNTFSSAGKSCARDRPVP